MGESKIKRASRYPGELLRSVKGLRRDSDAAGSKTAIVNSSVDGSTDHSKVQSSVPALLAPRGAPRVCLFASTQKGTLPVHLEAAKALAQALHKHDAQLVYGGGSTGLMGAVAQERVRLGGPETVLGVIPYSLVPTERQGRGTDGLKQEGKDKQEAAKEMTGTAAPNTTESDPEVWQKWTDVYELPLDEQYGRVVGTASLPRRKEVMMAMTPSGRGASRRKGGFVALPGGFGSFDEVLTVLTARQLGLTAGDMVLINVDGFWNGFVQWMENAGDNGFLGAESRSFITVVDTAEAAVEHLLGISPTTV